MPAGRPGTRSKARSSSRRWRSCGSASAWPTATEHDLGADEVRRELLAAMHPHLPDLRAPAHVQRRADGLEDVALPRRGEHVDLQLAGGEAVAGLEVAHRAPGGDGVGERRPDPAMHIAAGVQVATVDHQAAAHVLVGDLGQLDAEVAWEEAVECLAAELGGDL